MEIKTNIIIKATPEKVWNVLTDFNAYPDWNPFIKSIKGTPKVGNQIKVELNEMTFKPKVLAYVPNKEFRWKGHLFFKGLFDGEHIFIIEDNNDDTITFHHNEKFQGLLVPLFQNKLLSETKKGFEQMNVKLKEIIEQKQ